MSVTLKESAMQVETVEDVVKWTNRNLVSISKHMNWLEDMTKKSFEACHDDFDKMAKRIKKLERRSRFNWIVTAAAIGVAGYLLNKLNNDVRDAYLDGIDTDLENRKVDDKLDELENRVDFLVNRVNDLENKN